ncbi:MAG: bifunctional (p)ppGpp synthetase/guanosine-3',5'-bis(diphosphate) 3'-pyrophosphohydrolase, partial [Chloroflexia bacterium]|nr:bifunctional (p)ppGpp synthetase/guanosine-3',5'-bis(diphosphate) 3'-pyrophosphohydrolase [Chloroflexia bacterium]
MVTVPTLHRDPAPTPRTAGSGEPANGLAEAADRELHVRRRLEDLVETISEYLPNGNLDLVRRAGELAIVAHGDERRKSGEPYALHPIAVGAILARMQLDPETIAGALLHDVVEDTPVDSAQIEREFGPRVARLVDGVTKLGRLPWTTDDGGGAREKTHQAESLRKMFLAMVDDIGVVLIKLADRLHNMRTLAALPLDKQRKIAQQTMEIYAPLANRLGIWPFKSELEDLSFRYLDPEPFAALHDELEKRGRDSAPYLEGVRTEVTAALRAGGIEAEITGRAKHIFSIYRKMKRTQRSLDEIY